MLGIILIYFIGKRFYDLAGEFDKHQWKHAIIGVVSYYGTLIVVQMIIFMIYFMMNPAELDYEGDVDSSTEMIVGLISIPFGILACYLSFKYFQKKWNKEKQLEAVSIDDIGSNPID